LALDGFARANKPIDPVPVRDFTSWAVPNCVSAALAGAWQAG
jgi:hypothetical protein